MASSDFILNLLAGGLLGIVGQGIRVIIGLKKLNTDNNTASINSQPTEDFNLKRLLLSLFIGFIAGALGFIAKLIANKDAPFAITPEFAMAMIAGGYSGVDFIEGAFKMYLPKTSSDQAANVADEAKPQTAKG